LINEKIMDILVNHLRVDSITEDERSINGFGLVSTGSGVGGGGVCFGSLLLGNII
jgi:hypothetical protein